MLNLKTINIDNEVFSIEKLESILHKYPKGYYHILWNTKKSTWEMKLKWNGKEFIDLHPKSIST